MSSACLVIAAICRIWSPGDDCRPERDAAPAWVYQCYADQEWHGRQRTVEQMLADCRLSISGERAKWKRMGALAGRVECMENHNTTGDENEYC